MAHARLPSQRQILQKSWFEQLWTEQEGLCALCGKAMPKSRFETPHATVWKKQRPTFDHIYPVSKGGRDNIENLQLAHMTCNKIKADNI